MNKADMFFPHRLLLNQSLRKEAEKLRTHIDEYQQRYDVQYQKIVEELETTRDKLNKEYEQALDAILTSLSAESETMQALSEAVSVYVSAFFERQLVYKKKDLNVLQTAIVDEYIGFLSAQMREIGIEIDMLRERGELLASKADISDIILLVQLSGCALPVDSIHDAKELLDCVNNRLEVLLEGEETVEWKPLRTVRTILEERVSYLAEIQFISWVVEQKIQLSKGLNAARDVQNGMKRMLSEENKNLISEIERLDSVLFDKAKVIRFYWAQRIVYCNAELSGCFAEIEEVKEKQKRLKDDWDDDENERLSRRYLELSRRIDRLRPDINHHKTSRKEFMSFTYQMQVPIIKIGRADQRDEDLFVDSRLTELRQIIAEGMEAAEEVYTMELKRLVSAKEDYMREQESVLSEIEERLEAAKKGLQIAQEQLESRKSDALKAARSYAAMVEQQHLEQEKAVTSAKLKLASIQANDTRFVLLRWFSDTPEELKAKAVYYSEYKKLMSKQAELEIARKKVSSNSFADDPDIAAAQTAFEHAKTNVDVISAELDIERAAYNCRITEYDKMIQSLKPHPERPTFEEQSELNRILTWKARQENRTEKRVKRP